jgi:predicted nucleic acid-binding protein
MNRVDVADTSPLIGLQRIDRLELLRDLFGEVLVPPAVMHEFVRRATPPAWLVERRPPAPLDPRLSGRPLGGGEREAIALALHLGVDWVILDDEAGRRLAASLGLPVIGTLGVVLLATEEGVVDAVRPLVDALTAVNFHLAPRLVARILTDAGERGADP